MQRAFQLHALEINEAIGERPHQGINAATLRCSAVRIP